MSARAKSPTKPGAKAAPAAAGANPLELKLKEAQDKAAADAQQRNYAQLERVRQLAGAFPRAAGRRSAHARCVDLADLTCVRPPATLPGQNPKLLGGHQGGASGRQGAAARAGPGGGRRCRAGGGRAEGAYHTTAAGCC